MLTESRRILLIHTDDVVEEMLILCLETIPDCKVITVDSAMEIINRALDADAILLDIDEMMPDSSWREIRQNLKLNSFTYSIPLILLTATPQSQELVELQQTQSINAIAKSFDLLKLAKEISILLNWQ